MKRIILICLLLCMVLSFTACNKEKNEDATTTTQNVTTTEKVSKETKNEKTSESTTVEEKTTVNKNADTTKSIATTTTAKSTTTTTARTTTTTTTKSSKSTGNGLMSSFSTSDMNGNTVTQAVLKGKKVTMFNVWWTQCSPCINEMPDLAELNSKYSNFQVIGIVWDYNNTESVNSIISQTGANYTHIKLDSGIYSKVQTAGYGGYVPFTFFVDENGNQLTFTCNGEKVTSIAGAQDWEPIIQELLA